MIRKDTEARYVWGLKTKIGSIGPQAKVRHPPVFAFKYSQAAENRPVSVL